MSNIDIRKYNRSTAKELRAVLKEALLHQESIRKENAQLLEENDALHAKLRGTLLTVSLEASWNCPHCGFTNAVDNPVVASGGELECLDCGHLVVAE